MNIILEPYTLSLIIILIGFLIIFLIMNRMNNFNKRFSNYTLKKINKKEDIYGDKVYNSFDKIISYISNKISKIGLFKTYSYNYEKYSNNSKSKQNLFDYISLKIIFVVIGIITYLISSSISKDFLIEYFLLFIIVFFYLPDFYYEIKFELWRRKIDKDLFNAVIILDNCFKDGMNMHQAIYKVYKTLQGPVALEFEKIYKDINYGLSVSKVLTRFDKRMNNKTSSLISKTLLLAHNNQVNLESAFSLVVNNTKTKSQLYSKYIETTKITKIIKKVLILTPPLTWLIMFFIKDNYFNFLINQYGRLIFLIILILYFVYVYISKRIFDFDRLNKEDEVFFNLVLELFKVNNDLNKSFIIAISNIDSPFSNKIAKKIKESKNKNIEMTLLEITNNNELITLLINSFISKNIDNIKENIKYLGDNEKVLIGSNINSMSIKFLIISLIFLIPILILIVNIPEIVKLL